MSYNVPSLHDGCGLVSVNFRINENMNKNGEFRKAKKDLIDKIAEKEIKTELYERPNTNINPGA